MSTTFKSNVQDETVNNNLTVDTNTLFVDAANNSIGFGTLTPTAGHRIDVQGKSIFSDILGLPKIATGSLPTASSYQGYIAYDLTLNKFVYSNGTSWIDPSAGSVTIGTTTAASGTVGSVLFVGTGPVIAQNNTSFFWDNTNNRLGIGSSSPAVTLDVVGNTVNTDANNTVSALRQTGSFTKNDTNTRQFYVQQIKPTFNFGVSNTNTTVDIFSIDSTNTSTTGLTANLINASYGGTSKFKVTSTGEIQVNGSTGTSGQVLTSAGTGAPPTWTTVSGGSMSIGGSVGSGTTGSILFVGPGPVLAQDNANFFWDDTNNRLGLGNAAPSDTLHVTGTLRTTGIVGIGQAPSTGTTLISLGGTGIIPIEASSTDTSGNFAALICRSSGSFCFQQFYYSTSTFGGTVYGGAASTGFVQGINLSTTSGNSIGFRIGTTNMGTFNSSSFSLGTPFYVDITNGRVGIGTTTPLAGFKLNVTGGIKSAYCGLGSDSEAVNNDSVKYYSNFGSNYWATTIMSSNLYIKGDGTEQLKTAIAHSTMSGAAIKIPGAGQTRQNWVEFWTTPTASVSADANYAQSTPRVVIDDTGRMGIGNVSPAAKIDITGLTINTDATNTVAVANYTNSFTKNDTNVRQFYVERIKPTFNFGVSNTNTTVDILSIDSTNTAVTGLTANLINASYGGTSKFKVDSAGVVTTGSSLGVGVAPSFPLHVNGASNAKLYFANGFSSSSPSLTVDNPSGKVQNFTTGTTGGGIIWDNTGTFNFLSDSAATIRAGTTGNSGTIRAGFTTGGDFFTGSTAGNSLYVDNTNNRVGIGTTTPSQGSLWIKNSSSGATTDVLWLVNPNNTTNTGVRIAFNVDATTDSTPDAALDFINSGGNFQGDFSFKQWDGAALTESFRINATRDVKITGSTVTTAATNFVAALTQNATFTKNDTNTRQFYVSQIKPTFNFGGSNANTTVDILSIDSTNTSTTGLTANLINASYGGTSKFKVASDGTITASNKITAVTDPTSAQDAATKNYVDTKTGPAILSFGATTTTSVASTTTYIWPGYGSTDSATSEIGIIAPAAGKIAKLYIKAATGPTTDSIVFTVRKNGTDQSVTATLAAAGTTANDTTNSFTVAAGDEITIKAVSGATLTVGAVGLRIGLQYTIG